VGNETTAIAMDQWYDTRNTKTIYFNPSVIKQVKQRTKSA
jgi:hypothetical protein